MATTVIATATASPKARIDYKRYVLYGTLFSIPPLLVFYPTRTAKTIQQSSRRPISAIQALRGRYVSTGVMGIYSGAGWFFVAVCVGRLLNFGTYDSLKEWSHAGNGPQMNDVTQSLVFGGTSAVLSNLLLVPFDVITQQLQAHQESTRKSNAVPMPSLDKRNLSTSALQASVEAPVQKFSIPKLIKAEGGISFLYRGLSATLFSSVPYFTIYFSSYEFCRLTLPGLHPFFQHSDETTPISLDATSTTLLGGTLASTLATMLSAPCDVVKTKIQVARKSSGEAVDIRWLSVFRQIVREQGIKGLWLGSGTRLVALAPLGALNFYIFNWVKYLSRIEA